MITSLLSSAGRHGENLTTSLQNTEGEAPVVGTGQTPVLVCALVFLDLELEKETNRKLITSVFLNLAHSLQERKSLRVFKLDISSKQHGQDRGNHFVSDSV